MAKLTRADAAAEVAEHIIEHAAHGYSQPNRAGDGTIETLTLSDGSKVTIHGGDYDCSELVRMCYRAVNVLPYGSYMWTGNEESLLTKHGFRKVAAAAPSKMKRGDVLFRAGHTEIYLGKNKQGGARRSETYSVNGRKGDQDGGEIASSAYKSGDWTCAFRYNEPKGETPSKVEPEPKKETKPAPEPKAPQIVAGIYRVQVSALNVRDKASLKGGVKAVYNQGQTIRLDGTCTVADGYVWGRYIGAASGKYRYVAMGPTSKPSEYLKLV